MTTNRLDKLGGEGSHSLQSEAGAVRKTFVLLLLALVFILQVALIDRYIASRENMVFDFTHRWIGAQAMLFQHRNPYSSEVTNEIQMTLFNRQAAPETWQQSFLYPPFIAFTIPHFLLPHRLGLSTWIVTQQWLLIGAIWLLLVTSNAGTIKPAWLLTVTLAAVLCRYSLMNLAYAQFSILILFWTVVTWWLWSRGSFLLAGVALTQLTIKPQLALLIVPIWLALAVARRRWSFCLAFGITLILLLAIPFLFIGNWIPDFIELVRVATSSPIHSARQGSGILADLAAPLILGTLLLILALKSPERWEGRNLGFFLSLVVAVTLLATPYSFSYNLVFALFPLLFGLAVLYPMRGKWATLLQLAYLLCLALLPWLLWALVPAARLESFEYWFFPAIVLLLLVALAALAHGRIQT